MTKMLLKKLHKCKVMKILVYTQFPIMTENSKALGLRFLVYSERKNITAPLGT